jgi:hypothetical protein
VVFEKVVFFYDVKSVEFVLLKVANSYLSRLIVRFCLLSWPLITKMSAMKLNMISDAMTA